MSQLQTDTVKIYVERRRIRDAFRFHNLFDRSEFVAQANLGLLGQNIPDAALIDHKKAELRRSGYNVAVTTDHAGLKVKLAVLEYLVKKVADLQRPEPLILKPEDFQFLGSCKVALSGTPHCSHLEV